MLMGFLADLKHIFVYIDLLLIVTDLSCESPHFWSFIVIVTKYYCCLCCCLVFFFFFLLLKDSQLTIPVNHLSMCFYTIDENWWFKKKTNLCCVGRCVVYESVVHICSFLGFCSNKNVNTKQTKLKLLTKVLTVTFVFLPSNRFAGTDLMISLIYFDRQAPPLKALKITNLG